MLSDLCLTELSSFGLQIRVGPQTLGCFFTQGRAGSFFRVHTFFIFSSALLVGTAVVVLHAHIRAALAQQLSPGSEGGLPSEDDAVA